METVDNSFKENNLYEVIRAGYERRKPVSRLLYITKMRELEEQDEKVSREVTLGNLREEVRNLMRVSREEFNLMIVYIGTVYALVGIEVIYWITAE